MGFPLKKGMTRNDPRYRKHEIGAYTYGTPLIYGGREEDILNVSKLKIGKFCSIADGVVIYLGGYHRTDWITTYPLNQMFKGYEHIKDNVISKGDVIIGNDVWIANKSTILSGVKISDGAVIGTNSVVTKSVGPYSIVAGNPAMEIRKRFDEKTIKNCLRFDGGIGT